MWPHGQTLLTLSPAHNVVETFWPCHLGKGWNCLRGSGKLFYLNVCVDLGSGQLFSECVLVFFFLPLFERPGQFSCECYRLYSMKVKCLADFLKWEMPVQHPLSLKLMLYVFDSHQAGDNLCSFTAFIHLLRIRWAL